MRTLLTFFGCLAFLSCTVSYDGTHGGGSGSADAALGYTDSDSRTDIDVGIDIKERPQVVSGMTRAGVTFVIEVSNRTSEPLRLTRVQLQSVAEESTLAPLTGAKFNKTIDVGKTERVELGAFFDVNGDDILALDGPMLIRATLYLRDESGAEQREFFTRRLGSLGVGVSTRPQTRTR